MPNLQGVRTWTADVVVDGVVLPATDSTYDLKRDQLARAAADVRDLLPSGTVGNHGERVGRIILFKETKAHGLVPEGSYDVIRNSRNGSYVANGAYYVAPETERSARS